MYYWASIGRYYVMGIQVEHVEYSLLQCNKTISTESKKELNQKDYHDAKRRIYLNKSKIYLIGISSIRRLLLKLI